MWPHYVYIVCLYHCSKFNVYSRVSECPTLDAPEFGNVQTAYGTTYGETAGYTCDKGYMIYGVSSRTCQHNAIWTATAPTCIILGNKSKSIDTLSTTKTFVCQAIFRLTLITELSFSMFGDFHLTVKNITWCSEWLIDFSKYVYR